MNGFVRAHGGRESGRERAGVTRRKVEERVFVRWERLRKGGREGGGGGVRVSCTGLPCVDGPIPGL